MSLHHYVTSVHTHTLITFVSFVCVIKIKLQDKEVRSGLLQPRTRENHEKHVHEASRDHTMAKHHGVKRGCPLTEKLTHFHVVNGFPPYILHDFLEGIVPIVTMP